MKDYFEGHSKMSMNLYFTVATCKPYLNWTVFSFALH